MHELVLRIKQPELCYVFAENATKRGHEGLALEAYRRAVDLRAEAHEDATADERLALKAFYAYEVKRSFFHHNILKAHAICGLSTVNILLSLKRANMTLISLTITAHSASFFFNNWPYRFFFFNFCS